MTHRAINFSAGPSALPLSVLERAAGDLLNYQLSGIGIAEISHRSREFTSLLSSLESHIRSQLNVPPTHKILFTQGGGTAQFSAVVYNLLARHWLLYPDAHLRRLQYVLTGSWSKKAMEEAKRLCVGPRGAGGSVETVVDARVYSTNGKSFDNIPPHSEFQFHSGVTPPALIYYCENETVDGVQFSNDLASPTSFPFDLLLPPTNDPSTETSLLPLVADYSSSFMSRPIPRLADHAVIYAGAQKNIGPAGLTILIVRQDCIVHTEAASLLGAAPVPVTMSYKVLADSGSLYNTPSVLPTHVAALVLERMKELGGTEYYQKMNERKKEKVYATVREGEELGILRNKVRPGSQSWMNVVFEVLGEGAEKRFLEGAEARGMKGLKGHRSVGGIRVSLYNAVTEEQTDQLVAYIREFVQNEVSFKK